MIELQDVARAGAAACRARIGPGEVLGIIGPSGSGRTALLEAVAGARRHQGRVVVSGRPRRRGDVGLAPEEPEQILFGRTARDAVRAPEGLEMLERLGAGHLRDREWLSLSAGERRRVALAAVLGLRRPLLLFDRPTSGLDPEGAGAFWQALRATRSAAVIVAHDRTEAAACDQWLWLPTGGPAVPAHRILPREAPWPPDPRVLLGWVLCGAEPKSDEELIGEVHRWRMRTGRPR